MNDWGSIFLYGYLGWIVLSDLNLLLVGGYCLAVGNRHAFSQPIWWFFARRLLGITLGVAAVILYREGLLGWLWAIYLAFAISIPELIYRMWKDITKTSNTPSEAK